MSSLNARSSTWIALDTKLLAMIEEARRALEDSSLDESKTQLTRGYIKALREVRELPLRDNSPASQIGSPDYN